MEQGLAVLGVVLAIPIGVAFGVLYCYLHFRLFYRVPVSLKAISSVLAPASPVRIHRSDFANVSAFPSSKKANGLWQVKRLPVSCMSTKGYSEVVAPIQECRLAVTNALAPAAVDRLNDLPVARKNPAMYESITVHSEAPCVVGGCDTEEIMVLYPEFEQNRRTIRGFSGEQLVSLKTDSWDANQRVLQGLSSSLRNSLESIYTDITLLNNLVWLSSEFHRNSPNIRQHYSNLGTNIADRIETLLKVPLSPVG
jgi:hypothetical protein